MTMCPVHMTSIKKTEDKINRGCREGEGTEL